MSLGKDRRWSSGCQMSFAGGPVPNRPLTGDSQWSQGLGTHALVCFCKISLMWPVHLFVCFIVQVQLSPFSYHHIPPAQPSTPPTLNPTPLWLCPFVLYTCSLTLITFPLFSISLLKYSLSSSILLPSSFIIVVVIILNSFFWQVAYLRFDYFFLFFFGPHCSVSSFCFSLSVCFCV